MVAGRTAKEEGDGGGNVHTCPPYLRATGQMAIFATPKAHRPEILENWDVATPPTQSKTRALALPPPNLQANAMAI